MIDFLLTSTPYSVLVKVVVKMISARIEDHTTHHHHLSHYEYRYFVRGIFERERSEKKRSVLICTVHPYSTYLRRILEKTAMTHPKFTR